MIEFQTDTATFIFDKKRISMFQRYEPNGSPFARLIGEVRFKRRVGPWVRQSRLIADETKGHVIVGSNIRVTIHPESLMVIETDDGAPLQARIKTGRFEDWNKQNNDTAASMSADRRGGILTRVETNRVGCAVLPSRILDKAALYGNDERPHVAMVFTVEHVKMALDNQSKWLGRLEKRGFGTLVLFGEGLYTEGVYPISLGGRYAYMYKDGEAILKLIEVAHDRGFKVLGYVLPYNFQRVNQEFSATLDWMRRHAAQFKLDGWYLDGAQFHPIAKWLENYQAVRSVREEIDKSGDGSLILHGSMDVWGERSGVIASPIDAFCDYIIRGERTPIYSMDDPLVYYSRAFGGAVTNWKRFNPDHEKGQPTEAMIRETYRAMGEWGSARVGFGDNLEKFWDVDFEPVFNEARDAWRREYAK